MPNPNNQHPHLTGSEQSLEELSLQNLEGGNGLKASTLSVPEQISAETGRQMGNLIAHLNKLGKLNIGSYSNDEQFTQEMAQLYQSQLHSLHSNLNSFSKVFQSRNNLFKNLKNRLSPQELAILSGNFQPHQYRKLVSQIIDSKQNTPDKFTAEEIQKLKNATPQNLPDILNELKNTNKLTAEQADQLTDLIPGDQEYLKERTQQILNKIQQDDLTEGTNYFNTFNQVAAEEKALEKEFLLVMNQYGEIQDILANKVKDYYEQAENQSKKYDLIRQLKRDTGLEISPGAVFWAENWAENSDDSSNPPHNVKITIDDIAFGKTGLLNGDEAAIPGFQPMITFTTDTPSGQITTQTLSAEALNRHFYNFNVQEDLNSLENLAASLGLAEISIGQKFTLPVQKDGEIIEETFTIESLDNNQITLDRPIEQKIKIPGSLLSENSSFQTFTYPEFARWYRRNHILPEISSLEDANQHLAQIHQNFRENFGLDEDSPPIDLSAAMPLTLATISSPLDESNYFFLRSASPTEVIYEDGSEEGKKVSLTEFLRNVENNFLIPASTEESEKQYQNLMARGENPANDNAEVPDPVAANDNSSSETPGKSPASSGPGFLKKLWNETSFMNIMELIELYWTAPKDEIINALKSKSEKKVAGIGKGKLYSSLPWPLNMASGLTDTYEDKYNAKNSQEVKDKLEWFDKNKDKDGVKEVMYDTSDKNELMACLKFLSNKGALRSDDEKFIKVLNDVLGGATYPKEQLYPKEFWGKPVVIGEDLDKGLFLPDQFKLILEEAYGKGIYDEIFGTNNSKYREKRDRTNSELHDKFEFTREGIGPEIQKRMLAFMEGEKVDAAEFDGMMLGAITKDEISPEQWMMILIFAFGYKNKEGKTLLPYERFNTYISDLSKIPYFLWFALKHNLVDEKGNPILDKEGKPVRGHLRANELNKIFKDVIQKDIDANIANGIPADSPKVLAAGKNMIKWMHSVPLTHPAITEKAGERAGDAEQSKAIGHYVTPLVTNTDAIDNLLVKYQGGRRSEKVIKMAICGYGSQLKARAELLKDLPENQRKLAVNNFINQYTGWIYFDATIRGTRGRATRYMRMKDTDLEGAVDADRKRQVLEFANETRDFTHDLATAFGRRIGNTEIINLANQLLRGRDQQNDAGEERLRDLLNVQMRKFAESNYSEFVEIVNQATSQIVGLSGLQLSKEEKEKLEEQDKAKAAKAA